MGLSRHSNDSIITPEIRKFAESAQTQESLSRCFDLLRADWWNLWEAKYWLESKICIHNGLKKKIFQMKFIELKGKWDSTGDASFERLPEHFTVDLFKGWIQAQLGDSVDLFKGWLA